MKLINKKNSVNLLILFLFISLCTNVYTSYMNGKYSMRAGRTAYRNLENLKHRNEMNLMIIDDSIKAGSVTNEELLNLYRNYNSLMDSMIVLGTDYVKDENDKLLEKPIKKVVSYGSIPNINPADIVSTLENLLYEYIKIEMVNHDEKIILQGKVLENFTTMKNISNDINNFFKDVYSQKLINVKDENKEKIVIKKGYWKDAYDEMYLILLEYAEYEFSIE